MFTIGGFTKEQSKTLLNYCNGEATLALNRKFNPMYSKGRNRKTEHQDECFQLMMHISLLEDWCFRKYLQMEREEAISRLIYHNYFPNFISFTSMKIGRKVIDMTFKVYEEKEKRELSLDY